MEYLGITSPIDALKEKEAILEFLKDYWIIKSRKDFNLEEIIELILRKGIDRGIAFQEREIVRGAYLLRTAIECIRQGMNIRVYCVEEKYGKLIHPKKYRPLKQN